MRGWYQKWGKRVIDVILAGAALVVLFPVVLIIALVIRMSMGPPVFFHQVRAGLHGKPFVMHKFRTMLNLKDARGNMLPDEQRLTGIAKLIRRFSLDEFPELWNVLKGDMSIVGPRPLLLDYLPLYSAEQMRRHHVKPGITGWAQINGRNAISWEEKFKFDVWYVDNWNFRLDIKIILLTIIKVLSGEGIRAKGYATMPKFRG